MFRAKAPHFHEPDTSQVTKISEQHIANAALHKASPIAVVEKEIPPVKIELSCYIESQMMVHSFVYDNSMSLFKNGLPVLLPCMHAWLS